MSLLTRTKNSVLFLNIFGAFWEFFFGAFDKYVEMMCYFWELEQPEGGEHSDNPVDEGRTVVLTKCP